MGTEREVPAGAREAAAEDVPRAPSPGDDPLESLSERLRAAQQSAERLVREATATAERAAAHSEHEAGRRPPPRGYKAPGPEGRAGAAGADAQALVALLELGRGLVPPELRTQIGALLRELLLLARALIDWYLERLDAERRAPVEVQDIPIT